MGVARVVTVLVRKIGVKIVWKHVLEDSRLAYSTVLSVNMV